VEIRNNSGASAQVLNKLKQKSSLEYFCLIPQGCVLGFPLQNNVKVRLAFQIAGSAARNTDGGCMEIGELQSEFAAEALRRGEEQQELRSRRQKRLDRVIRKSEIE
jgi:hypothetical protein